MFTDTHSIEKMFSFRSAAKKISLPRLLPILALAVAITLTVLPGNAFAQDDPPTRVARLNFIQGPVSFQPAGTQDWIDASPNRPITTGDNLWTDQSARGELHVDSTAIRLSGLTGISFLNLDDNVTQLQLAQGSLDIHVRQLADSEAFEIDTPNLALSILRPGDYRITVDPNGGSSIIDVRSGSGEVTGGGQSFNLNPGQSYAFYGTDQLNLQAQRLPGRDDFDNWCASRDQREEQSVSARYVSRDVIGYDDLDAYGTWRQDPDYGPVWIPSGVDADWAPYHNGHWVSIAPWGWTWVEDEPWGFAPFHYGRWAVIGGTWGWVPGPVAIVGPGGGAFGRPGYVRPVYAPALVAFVGGGGFSVSLSFGGGPGVAWFPLGPRDVWVPGYRCSPAYVQNVNIRNTRVVNVTQVTNVYNNVYINRNTTVVNNYTYANNVRAVTAVSRTTFVNGQPAGRASVQISQDQIRNPRVAENAPLQPVRQSFYGNQSASKYAPPPALANRAIVTRRTPAPQVVPLGHTQSFANSNGGFKPSAPGQQQGFNGRGNPPSSGNPNGNGGFNPNANRNPNGKFNQPANNNPNNAPNNTVNNPANNPYNRPGIQETPNNSANPNINPNGNQNARPGSQNTSPDSNFNRNDRGGFGRNPNNNAAPASNPNPAPAAVPAQTPAQNNVPASNSNPNGRDRQGFGRAPNSNAASGGAAPVTNPNGPGAANSNANPNAHSGFQPPSRNNNPTPNANAPAAVNPAAHPASQAQPAAPAAKTPPPPKPPAQGQDKEEKDSEHKDKDHKNDRQ